MIRTLRLKFICVTMVIVTVLLGVIFGLVIQRTAADLEENSIEFLRHAADGPDRPGPQGGPPSKLQLPCFIVRVTPWGQSVERSDSFDLSDEQMLTDIISEAMASETEVGELTEYSLRFCRLERPTGLTLIFADISTEKATLRDLQLNCIAIGTLSLLAEESAKREQERKDRDAAEKAARAERKAKAAEEKAAKGEASVKTAVRGKKSAALSNAVKQAARAAKEAAESKAKADLAAKRAAGVAAAEAAVAAEAPKAEEAAAPTAE